MKTNNGILILLLAIVIGMSIQRPVLIPLIIAASVASTYVILDENTREVIEEERSDQKEDNAVSARAASNAASDAPVEPRRATANQLNDETDTKDEKEAGTDNATTQDKPQPPLSGAQMQQRLDDLMLSRARALRDITHPPRERLDRLLDKAFDDLEKTSTRRDIYTVLEEEEENETCGSRLPSA